MQRSVFQLAAVIAVIAFAAASLSLYAASTGRRLLIFGVHISPASFGPGLLLMTAFWLIAVVCLVLSLARRERRRWDLRVSSGVTFGAPWTRRGCIWHPLMVSVSATHRGETRNSYSCFGSAVGLRKRPPDRSAFVALRSEAAQRNGFSVPSLGDQYLLRHLRGLCGPRVSSAF